MKAMELTNPDFMSTNVILNGLPLPNTWWHRNCNGKRYYLRDAPKGSPGFERVWIFLEGTNKCLHIKAKSLLKNYSPIDTAGMETKSKTLPA